MRPVPALEAILSTPALWRGRQAKLEQRAVLSSGWPQLDALLPGGGWPLGSLIEVGIAQPGSGECALFFPLWRSRSPSALPTTVARSPRKKAARSSTPISAITLIDPPFLPYAPGWCHAGVDLARLWWITARSERQRLWAAEQSLRSGVCAAVLMWPQKIDSNALRRLQLAAESAKTLALCFRPEHELAQASHAPIRLHLQARASAWSIELIKCRGRTGGARCTIVTGETTALPMAQHAVPIASRFPLNPSGGG